MQGAKTFLRAANDEKKYGFCSLLCVCLLAQCIFTFFTHN